jgi:putative ABC transport system ATP-binding protein
MGARLECRGVSKVYEGGLAAEPVLRDVSLAVPAGQTCVLLGPSGSGKTTLLSILGCLLSPTSGSVRVCGEPVAPGSAGHRAEIRRRHIGFVFQQAQLLPFLTLAENVRLVGRNAGLRGKELVGRVDDLLERLDLGEVKDRLPAQASGGQRQRAAVARSLVHRPAAILADEPTAALDWRHGETVIRLLTEQARRAQAALIAVTHDTRLVEQFDRVLVVREGRLQEP